MWRVRVVIPWAMVLVGCQLDSFGAGTAQVSSDGTTASSPEASTTSATGEVDDSTTDVTAETTETTETTTGMLDGTTSTSTDTGPLMHPMVSISDGETYDFGEQDIDGSVEHTFVITNDGDGPAEAFEIGGLFEPFITASTDCPATLEAADSCGITVRFEPDLFGVHQEELQVTFDDAGMPASATRPIQGQGVGVTGNLLSNGGGEEGALGAIPPQDWVITSGPEWTTTEQATPVEGHRTIYSAGGPVGLDDFIAHQLVHVSPLTTWGDAAGVRFYYRAFHRAWSAGDDPNHVEFRFTDAGVTQLEQHVSPSNDTSTWEERTGDWVAPADTHHVQILLVCERQTGNLCRAYFDEVEVWAEWQGE